MDISTAVLRSLAVIIFSTLCAGSCPSPGWKEDEETGKCYMFNEQKETFAKAERICKSYGTRILRYPKDMSKISILDLLNVTGLEIWIKSPAIVVEEKITGKENISSTGSSPGGGNVTTTPQVKTGYRPVARNPGECQAIRITNSVIVLVSRKCYTKLAFVCQEKRRQRKGKGMRTKVLIAIIAGSVILVLFIAVILKTCHKRFKTLERAEYSMVKKENEDKIDLQKAEYIRIGSVRQPEDKV